MKEDQIFVYCKCFCDLCFMRMVRLRLKSILVFNENSCFKIISNGTVLWLTVRSNIWLTWYQCRIVIVLFTWNILQDTGRAIQAVRQAPIYLSPPVKTWAYRRDRIHRARRTLKYVSFPYRVRDGRWRDKGTTVWYGAKTMVFCPHHVEKSSCNLGCRWPHHL